MITHKCCEYVPRGVVYITLIRLSVTHTVCQRPADLCEQIIIIFPLNTRGVLWVPCRFCAALSKCIKYYRENSMDSDTNIYIKC